MKRYAVTIQWDRHGDCGETRAFDGYASSRRLAIIQALAQIEFFPAGNVTVLAAELDGEGHIAFGAPKMGVEVSSG